MKHYDSNYDWDGTECEITVHFTYSPQTNDDPEYFALGKITLHSFKIADSTGDGHAISAFDLPDHVRESLENSLWDHMDLNDDYLESLPSKGRNG